MDVIQINWKEVAFSSPAGFDVIPKWILPSPDSLKPNFDGNASDCGNPSVTGVGGIIWNNVGCSILSFSRPAGFSSVSVAKLLATRIGLREAERLNLTNLFIEGPFLCNSVDLRSC